MEASRDAPPQGECSLGCAVNRTSLAPLAADNSHDPPGPPPAYYNVVRKVYPYSVRWVLFTVCIVVTIYLAFDGADHIRTAQRYGLTGAPFTLMIVTGVLSIVAASLQLVGLAAIYSERASYARLFTKANIATFVLAGVSHLLQVVVHFQYKQQLIAGCTTYNIGRTDQDTGYSGWLFWASSSSSSNGSPLTASQAADLCTGRWNSSSTGTIISLIVVLILGSIFVSTSFVYLRELLDPRSSRRQARGTATGMADGMQLHQLGHGDGPGAPNPCYAYNSDIPHGPGAPPVGGPFSGAYAAPPGPPPPTEPGYTASGYGYRGEEAGPLPPKYERGLSGNGSGSGEEGYEDDGKSLTGPHGYGAFEVAGSSRHAHSEEQEDERRASDTGHGQGRRRLSRDSDDVPRV